MVSHHPHIHRDEAEDFECLIVVGLADAHSSKPILTGSARVLFMLSVAAQSADNCLVCVYLFEALRACKRCWFEMFAAECVQIAAITDF